MKVVKILLIEEIKSTQFDGKVMDRVFNGYPRGMKSYELLRVKYGGLKFINRGRIIFNESSERKKSKDIR